MTDLTAGADEPAELERLRGRISALEGDHRRAFDQAQREADALFAQYQLSQLIASGGTPAELGRAVIVELVRLSGAAAGAIWLGETGRPELGLLATSGTFDDPMPERLADVADGRRLAAERPNIQLVVLGEEPPATLVALRLPADGGARRRRPASRPAGPPRAGRGVRRGAIARGLRAGAP